VVAEFKTLKSGSTHSSLESHPFSRVVVSVAGVTGTKLSHLKTRRTSMN